MSTILLSAFLVLFPGSTQAPKTARQWTDATGNYAFEADLLGRNDDTVILQRTNKDKDLVALSIEHLSKADQEYLKSKDVIESVRRSADRQQTWTMRSGLKVIGRVVEYGRREVTFQRKRGKIYVNDRLLTNYPEVQQRIAQKVVGHFEEVDIADERALEQWILTLKGAARTYNVEGVILELENGDEYGVPFFLFSEEDLKVLEPGWARWVATEGARQQEQQSKEREELMLRTAAQAYQRDREMNQQVKMMELTLLATAAGATDLWEVQLYPRPGVAAYPRIVVVPGSNSSAAKQVAMQRFPGYNAGAVSQANRPRF